MNKKWLSLLFCIAVVLSVVLWQASSPVKAEQEKTPYVTTATTTAEDVLEAWATGNYNYVKLGADLTLPMTAGEIAVDLAGNNLTVTGSGKVLAFDSANDTYDHLACGTLTMEDSVTCEQMHIAPNGNRYVAVVDGKRATLHRVEMDIKTVTLRSETAGLYYKAVYNCDKLIEQKVTAYGIVVSLENVPGADFKSVASDAYTVASGAFASGTTITSGSVVNIIKSNLSADENLKRSNMQLYANTYIDFGNGPIMADRENVGKTVASADFTGIAASLFEVLSALDSNFTGYSYIVKSQLNAFYKTWNCGWDFVNIGKQKTIDNSALKFEAGTTNAYCPACEKTVSWMGITQEYVDSLEVIPGETDSVFMSQSTYETMHYYLAEDITNSDNPVMGFFRGPGAGMTACLHLNDHNLTTTKTTAIFGNSGVINVMGNGVVTGYSPNATEGAAVRNGNRNVKNGLNLYGGTYKKTANTATTSPVVCFDGAGRIVSIYDGVVIDGGNGKAIFADSSSARQKEGFLKLYNCTVIGDIVLDAFDVYATNVEVVNATINGTLTIPEKHTLSLSGNVNITKLVMAEGVRLTTKGITTDSRIGIDADGAFTYATGSASKYVDVFVPVDSYKKVSVKNNVLRCTYDYTSNLVFEEGTTDAYCPVCEKVVTWTALSGEAALVLPANCHYYLADDVTYTGGGNAFLDTNAATVNSCIHLNGHNLTATNTRVLYGGSARNNIMGTGIVSGKAGGASGPGSTIQINNKNSANLVCLYGGTYRQQSNAPASEYVINLNSAGGNVKIYEDAVVEGNVAGKAIRIGDAGSNHSTVSVYGATIKGNILLEGSTSASYNVVLTLDGANVIGNVIANGKNTINLAHDVKISILDVEEQSLVTLGDLQSGADITVLNPGVFSQECEKAEEYVKYFSAVSINDKIVARNNQLVCKFSYTAKVQLDGNDQAYCPVCQESVTWTALENSESVINLKGGHYYLAEDLLFTADNHGNGASISGGGTGTVSCLNLNGHDITSTASPALFVSSGYVNVMGSGTVSGYHKTAKYGGAIHTNNKNANNGISLYSGTYKAYDKTNGNAVIGMQGSGATVVVYEDALINGQGGLAVNIGTNTNRDSILKLNYATVSGNITMAGTDSSTYVSKLEGVGATILGTLTVNGNNTINFSGRTQITSVVVGPGSLVGFDDMRAGSAIYVSSAMGIFTTPLDDAEGWLGYFNIPDDGEQLLIRNNCLFKGVQAEVPVANASDIEALLAAYAGRTVKYGEMHNHTNAGPTADGRFSLEEFRDRMLLLGMSFTTVVDHKQVAHMYHDDWISESTDGTGIVFIGGSEPAGRVTDGGEGSFHYNMLINDPELLLSIVKSTAEFVNKGITETLYADRGQNKDEAYDPTEFGKDPDGIVETWAYPNFTVASFKNLTKRIYEAGGLLVHVHPKYPSYMASNNPLDYFFGEDAGSKDAVAMGIELHISDNDNYSPSYEYNEQAYQTWVAILKAGKKCYATYGNDNHRLPSADSMTTIYASGNANSDEYMGYMHDGNFAPGWVGIRMQIGDASMGGTTDFAGQRVVFSIGDMYQNEHSDEYIPSTDGVPKATTWDSSYNPNNKYIVQVYDDGGLLMQSEVDPGQMNYFAFDADDNAKYYRVVVWDMTQGYRCGIGNPIWNTVD